MLEIPFNPFPTHVLCARVNLEPLTDAELPQRSQWTADDELARLMGVDVDAEPVESLEVELENNRQWLLHRLDQGARVYALKVNNRYIGDADLFLMPMERLAQITLFIGDRESWSQGYGTETVEGLLRMLFTWAPPTRAEREAAGHEHPPEETPFVRPEAVVVDVAPGNERALRFWAKLGFTQYDSDESGMTFWRMDAAAYFARRAGEATT